MEGKSQIKTFTCSVHPGEPIQRVCTNPSVQTSLKCMECLLMDSEKIEKSSLLKLNDFLDTIVKSFQAQGVNTSAGEAAPNNLVEFLSNEEQTIEAMRKHIENEKEKIRDRFAAIIQQLTALCETKQEECISLLDRQLNQLKVNYTYYRNKVDKHFSTEERAMDMASLIEKINQCVDTNAMEALVKDLKDDLKNNDQQFARQGRRNQIKESMEFLAWNLQKQTELKPSFVEIQETFIDQQKSNLLYNFESALIFKDSVLEISLSPSFDSKIIKKTEFVDLLKSWISPSGGPVGLKLLYRGSEHNYDGQKFHNLCDQFKHTLMVIKTSAGKICGGYSDQDWTSNPSNPFKYSEKAWLFSFEKKKKYPIKQTNFSRAICSTDPGISFGGGDLSIRLFGGFLRNLGGLSGASNIGYDYEVNETSQDQQLQSQDLFGDNQGGGLLPNMGGGLLGGGQAGGLLGRNQGGGLIHNMGGGLLGGGQAGGLLGRNFGGLLGGSFTPKNVADFTGAAEFDIEEIEVYCVLGKDL